MIITCPHNPVRQCAVLSTARPASVMTAAAVGEVGMCSGQSAGQQTLAASGLDVRSQ